MRLASIYRPPQDNETVLKLMGEVKTLDAASEEGKQAANMEEHMKAVIAKDAAKTPAKQVATARGRRMKSTLATWGGAVNFRGPKRNARVAQW